MSATRKANACILRAQWAVLWEAGRQVLKEMQMMEV